MPAAILPGPIDRCRQNQQLWIRPSSEENRDSEPSQPNGPRVVSCGFMWHYLSQITMFSLCMFMSTSHWNHYMLHFSQSMAMDSSVGNSCIPSIILATWRLKARSFLGSFKPTEPWGVAKLHDAQGSRWCLKSLDQKNKNVGYTIWYNRNRIKYWIA